LLCTSYFAQAAEPRWADIGGYQVDMALTPATQMKATESSLRHQIGLIEAARLPEPVQLFFRTVRIVVDPSLTGMNGQNAQRDGVWIIRARPGKWPADRAILLHELLHAYHREVLGRPTPPIDRAYRAAQQDGIYPPDYQGAYFLSNPAEYFAVIGEIYLAGTSFRPPYSCRNVQKAQPDFVAYLGSVFGERKCR